LLAPFAAPRAGLAGTIVVVVVVVSVGSTSGLAVVDVAVVGLSTVSKFSASRLAVGVLVFGGDCGCCSRHLLVDRCIVVVVVFFAFRSLAFPVSAPLVSSFVAVFAFVVFASTLASALAFLVFASALAFVVFASALASALALVIFASAFSSAVFTFAFVVLAFAILALAFAPFGRCCRFRRRFGRMFLCWTARGNLSSNHGGGESRTR